MLNVTVFLVTESVICICEGDPDTLQDAAIPRDGDTHAGEDIPIYARGPMSYLFQGTVSVFW